MYTLNDEWFMEHVLSHVEEVGKALGYSLVSLDVCGCTGQKASWYIEKDDNRRQIQLDELYQAYRNNTIPGLFRRLTF